MGKEYEKAQKEVYPKWYEAELNRQVLNSALVPLWVLLWIETSRQGDTLWFSFASASIYIIGSILDNLSAEQTFEVVDLADRKGIDHSLRETNPYLSKKPKPEDLYKGLKLLIDTIFVPISELIPPFGFGIGVGRTVASLNNFRQKRRLERAIQIASLKRK